MLMPTEDRQTRMDIDAFVYTQRKKREAKREDKTPGKESTTIRHAWLHYCCTFPRRPTPRSSKDATIILHRKRKAGGQPHAKKHNTPCMDALYFLHTQHNRREARGQRHDNTPRKHYTTPCMAALYPCPCPPPPHRSTRRSSTGATRAPCTARTAPPPAAGWTRSWPPPCSARGSPWPASEPSPPGRFIGGGGGTRRGREGDYCCCRRVFVRGRALCLFWYLCNCWPSRRKFFRNLPCNNLLVADCAGLCQ